MIGQYEISYANAEKFYHYIHLNVKTSKRIYSTFQRCCQKSNASNRQCT